MYRISSQPQNCDSDLQHISHEEIKTQLQSKIIHWKSNDHIEEKFHKTALAWCNENEDIPSALELLPLEHEVFHISIGLINKF